MNRSRTSRRFAPAAAILLLLAAPLAGAKTMFTTEEVGTGQLGGPGGWPAASNGHTGLAAGNSICQNLASAASLPNSGAYRAWLSDATTDAYCNVAGFSGKISDSCGQAQLPGGGPWVRTDGKPFAASLQELVTDHAVLYTAHVDQHGDPIVSGFTGTMTGTGASGAAAGANCANWTDGSDASSDTIGDLNAGSTGWTSWSSSACDSTYHLFCFESGSDTSLPAFDAPGAYAFVTSIGGRGDLGNWADANGQAGLAAGNEICRKAAERGKLPEPASYVAWLSDANTDAIDQLTIDGPWRRPDGVRIAATKAALQVVPHESSIDVDELGNHVSYYIFTGSQTNGVATLNDCGDWLLATGTASGGIAHSSGFFWSAGFSDDCSVPQYHLACFSNVVVILADGFESGGSSAWSAKVP